jgi:hypothetical protein
MHFTELLPMGLTLHHVEVRTDVHDDVTGYSSWKRASKFHILPAMYIYAF